MYKIGLKKRITKFNVTDSEIINVFHQWIQQDILENHLLLDVVDYKHVYDSTRFLLIAHEANIGIDFKNQIPGLIYLRKAPFTNNLTNDTLSILDIINFLELKLVENSILNGKIEFSNDFIFICNDRLHFQDNNSLKNNLTGQLSTVFNNYKIKLIPSEINSQLTININN